MGMSKKQPLIIFSILTITMLGFQNCAKVGVQDLNAVPNAKISGDIAQDPTVETQIEQPTNNNNTVDMNDDDMNHDDMDAPNSPPDVKPPVVSNPPPKSDDSNMSDDDTKPPVVNNPPSNPSTPVVNNPPTSPEEPPKSCRSVRIDQENHNDMQTVSCLNNPNEKCAVVCHRPHGNPGNAHNIAVGSSGAVAAHLRHGDTLGACGSSASSSQTQVCEDDEERHYDDNGNKNQAHGAQSTESKDCKGKKS